MPKKCLLLLLDGLGDRGHEALEGRTPLQAAATPTLDGLAAAGCSGLYHPALAGQALPSELAHFLLFGYGAEDFPGRAPLEALGAGLEPEPEDVAVMARLVQVTGEGGCLRLVRDTPPQGEPEDLASLAACLPELETHGLRFSWHHIKGLHGLLLLRGAGRIPSPLFTDTNPIRDRAMLIEPRPLAEASAEGTDTEADARNSALALKEYLVRAHELLRGHPVNQRREARGLPPINALATQRAGRLKPVRSFAQRYGLKAVCLASGDLYQGLSRYLGLEFRRMEDTHDLGGDLALRLEAAREALSDHDFVHVHTKAPDVAAHTKDCLRKRDVIAALDKGARDILPELAGDSELLLAVTADHSTASSGSLIHSGEPVPLLLHGQGVRRDAVARFDEISAAAGGLGFLRGRELMLMLLNHLDRARLLGLRDCPETFDDRPAWPGVYEAFKLE